MYYTNYTHTSIDQFEHSENKLCEEKPIDDAKVFPLKGDNC